MDGESEREGERCCEYIYACVRVVDRCLGIYNK